MKLYGPEFSVVDKRKNLRFPARLNNELSELVGAHIGDGHLAFHKGESEYIFQISGHPIKDKIYYDRFMYPLIKDLFNIETKPRFLSNGTYGYQLYSKALFLFLTKNFNLPDGKKARIVSIPRLFFSTRFLSACLRGIIDTDFYISFDRKSPVLGGWFASEKLVKDLRRGFDSLGIRSRCLFNDSYYDDRTKKYYTRHHIRVSRKDDFIKWFTVIGTHHPVLYLKYTQWLKGVYLTDKYIIENSKLLVLPNQ